MMTPQEVANCTFAKATLGGYNMASVDDFLDKLMTRTTKRTKMRRTKKNTTTRNMTKTGTKMRMTRTTTNTTRTNMKTNVLQGAVAGVRKISFPAGIHMMMNTTTGMMRRTKTRTMRTTMNTWTTMTLNSNF